MNNAPDQITLILSAAMTYEDTERPVAYVLRVPLGYVECWRSMAEGVRALSTGDAVRYIGTEANVRVVETAGDAMNRCLDKMAAGARQMVAMTEDVAEEVLAKCEFAAIKHERAELDLRFDMMSLSCTDRWTNAQHRSTEVRLVEIREAIAACLAQPAATAA